MVYAGDGGSGCHRHSHWGRRGEVVAVTLVVPVGAMRVAVMEIGFTAVNVIGQGKEGGGAVGSRGGEDSGGGRSDEGDGGWQNRHSWLCRGATCCVSACRWPYVYNNNS